MIVAPARGAVLPGHYAEAIGDRAEQDCADATYSLASIAVPRTLLVLDDPGKLQNAMDQGLVLADGVFEGFAVDGDGSAPARAKLHDKVGDALNGLLVEIIQGDDVPKH